MLRIRPSTSVEGVKKYFSDSLVKDDYYLAGPEIVGRWHGLGAKKFGLSGEIDQKDYFALCDKQNPNINESLNNRIDKNRRVSYDFTFSVPKSVSLIYEMTQDERILESFQCSVHETMTELERECEVRVRKGGAFRNRLSSNMVWGEFVHETARPVENSPADMHLHSHCVAFNASWDEEEKMWKAADFARIKSDGPYYEAAFESRVAYRLEELGYPIERHGSKKWEISGVDLATIDKFSQRTQEVEAKAAELGISDPALKAQLGAKTRANKQLDISLEELRASWRDRLSSAEERTIERIGKAAQRSGPAVPDLARAADKESKLALEHGITHVFERSSVVSDKDIIREALLVSRGQVTPESLHMTLRSHPKLLMAEKNGKVTVTTSEVLREEEEMVAFTAKGRGCYRPLGLGARPLKGENKPEYAQQRAAIYHAWMSPDRVIGIRGGAGVGKTHLMKETVAGIEASGKQVFVFAPSAEASRGVLRKDFANADTLQKLLVDPKVQQQVNNQVIWVDEAGLISTPNMRALFKIAEKQQARVILSGDYRQHKSVSRGDAFRTLIAEKVLEPADVNIIHRQKDATYKKAIAHLSKGDEWETKKGLDILDKSGAIHEISDPKERIDRLVSRYEEIQKAREEVVAVSPTHHEGRALTEALRASQRKNKVIRGQEREFTSQKALDLTEPQKKDAHNYEIGQVLQFSKHTKGIKAGEKVTVTKRDSKSLQVQKTTGDKLTVPLAQADRFQVFETETLALARGDKIRITRNGHSLPDAKGKKHRFNNGSIHDIVGFTRQGDIKVKNGWVIPKDYANLTHGYVTTSHAAQGITRARVLILQSSTSGRAASREQFYVSASRGEWSVDVFTDDKERLKHSISKSDTRTSALELARDVNQQQAELHLRLQHSLGISQDVELKRKLRLAREKEAELNPSDDLGMELEMEMRH